MQKNLPATPTNAPRRCRSGMKECKNTSQLPLQTLRVGAGQARRNVKKKQVSLQAVRVGSGPARIAVVRQSSRAQEVSE
jgi:hypothetical protein